DAAKMLSGERTIQVPVKLLRHNDTLDVQIVFTESFDCPDVLVWWMNRTTENAAITVEGLPPSWKVDVKTFHPGPPDQLTPRGPNHWEFNGVLLPGQGFEIRIGPA